MDAPAGRFISGECFLLCKDIFSDDGIAVLQGNPVKKMERITTRKLLCKSSQVLPSFGRNKKDKFYVRRMI
jgi:spermidine synthase